MLVVDGLKNVRRKGGWYGLVLVVLSAGSQPISKSERSSIVSQDVLPISGTELRRRCRTRRRDRHRLLSLHPVTTGSPELRRARPWGVPVAVSPPNQAPMTAAVPEIEIERTTRLLLTEGTGGLCVTTQVVYRPQSGVSARHGRFVKTTGKRLLY